MALGLLDAIYFSAQKKKKKKSGTSFLALRKEGMGYDATYMWNLKYDTNEFMKEKHRHRKQTYGYQRGKRWGRIN